LFVAGKPVSLGTAGPRVNLEDPTVATNDECSDPAAPHE
jgi:hypothetical protein